SFVLCRLSLCCWAKAGAQNKKVKATQQILFFNLFWSNIISPYGWAWKSSIRFLCDQSSSHSAQHSFFGRFDVVRMNLERSPVVNDEVFLGCHSDYAHFGMLAEQLVTDGRPSAGLVKRDDHEIRQGLLHIL